MLAAAEAVCRSATEAAACDLSNPDFAGFLARVRDLYQRGIFRFMDMDIVSSFLSRRETLLPDCTAVVLQALLVKLEENMVYEEHAFDDVIGEYTRILHEAVASRNITARDLEEWPLAEGLDRVRTMNEVLRDRRPLSSAMVMNFCKAKDRFGQTHDLQWLLEPPFGDPAVLKEEFANDDAGLLKNTDLYIYLVDKPWCSSLDEALVEQLRTATRRVHIIPYTGGPEREEQTAYFKFIDDHYEDLPDFTIFVHPDAPEHQGSHFLALARALRLLRTNSELAWRSFGYYPLATQLVVEPRRTWGQKYAASWRQFWRHVFDLPWDNYSAEPPRCHWELQPGSYLPELIDGADARLSRAQAKALCAKLNACAGITCGTPLTEAEEQEQAAYPHRSTRIPAEWSCTLRRGWPDGPHESPEVTEFSFLKNCSLTPGHSAHADAVFSLGDETDYTRVSGYFLCGHAADDATEYDVAGARARCSSLGRLCSGFTCADMELDACTVRAGHELYRSPSGEVTFVKEPQGASPGPVAGALLSVPLEAGASEVFQFYTGSQSMVRSDRIRAWPREWYAAMGANGAFCSEFSGYFEAVWHVMFGEPLSQWPREDDPRLPLFLKWGVPTKYSYGDERVI